MKKFRRKSVPIGSTSLREISRKTIDKLVLKHFGEKNVDIIYDINGRRTYVLSGRIYVQFNTVSDLKKKRKILLSLMDGVVDGVEDEKV